MVDALDALRRDVFDKRIRGIAGGLQVFFSTKDAARIERQVNTLRLEDLINDSVSKASRGLDVAEMRAASGIKARDPDDDDGDFLFTISSEDTDAMGDVVSVNGIHMDRFVRNPAVLNSHDSGNLPIAVSSTPAVSGKILTAIARFPKRGVSRKSDAMAAAVRGGLVRGASIGFVPLRWSFTKDPSRPMGVDFHECQLFEWSVCAVPANPSCLLLGAVGGKSAVPSKAEGRGATTPAERLVEVAQLRRRLRL